MADGLGEGRGAPRAAESRNSDLALGYDALETRTPERFGVEASQPTSKEKKTKGRTDRRTDRRADGQIGRQTETDIGLRAPKMARRNARSD